jgi:hypothetical protein
MPPVAAASALKGCAAVPLAAAGPGAQAQGRQAAPLRIALEQHPTLASFGASMNQGLDKTATYISGEQLRERFYRPELIQEKLHGEPHTSPQNTVRLHTDQ